MAEVVQYHLEEFLPVFKVLEEEGIFDLNEIKLIIKNLENYEYKLQRFDKDKETFLKYINYFQCLYQLIRRKYENLGISFNKEIRSFLNSKINFLYRKVAYKNQGDLKIWLSFINFSKRNHLKEQVGKLYNRMLQVHSDKPELWVSAAKWSLEDNNSTSVSRMYFQKGLRFNPNSFILHLEFFRFELIYIELIFKRKEIFLDGENTVEKSIFEFIPETHVENDSILEGQVAMVIIKNFLKNDDAILKVDKFLQVLDDFSKYSFYADLRQKILNYLKDNFSDKEETWDIIIRNSFNNNESFDQMVKNKEYRKIVDKFSNKKIWTFYLNYLTNNVKKFYSTDKFDVHLNLLENEIKNCLLNNLLSKKIYFQIIEGLCELKCDIIVLENLIKPGLNKWENNINLWHLYIKILIKSKNIKVEIINLVNKVIKILSSNEKIKRKNPIEFENNFNDFIKTIGDWALNNCNERECLKILEKNCFGNIQFYNLTISRKITEYFKPLLLEKVSKSNDSLIKCRTYYEKYKLMSPITKTFFLKMIEIECQQNFLDVKYVKKIFNELLNNFGEDDYKIWLDYCKFELKHGNYVDIAPIYESAKKCLSPAQCDLFIEKYSLMLKNKI